MTTDVNYRFISEKVSKDEKILIMQQNHFINLDGFEEELSQEKKIMISKEYRLENWAVKNIELASIGIESLREMKNE